MNGFEEVKTPQSQPLPHNTRHHVHISDDDYNKVIAYSMASGANLASSLHYFIDCGLKWIQDDLEEGPRRRKLRQDIESQRYKAMHEAAVALLREETDAYIVLQKVKRLEKDRLATELQYIAALAGPVIEAACAKNGIPIPEQAQILLKLAAPKPKPSAVASTPAAEATPQRDERLLNQNAEISRQF